MSDSRTMIPDVVDPLNETQDILVMIQGMDPRVAKDLDFFVRTFDFRQVSSFKELAEGYRGVFQLSLHLGPKGAHWRKTIDLCLKCLAGFERAMHDYLELEFPDELRKELDTYKRQMCEAARPLMEPAKFKEFAARMGYDDAKE